jgi:hypothetical protein
MSTPEQKHFKARRKAHIEYKKVSLHYFKPGDLHLDQIKPNGNKSHVNSNMRLHATHAKRDDVL